MPALSLASVVMRSPDQVSTNLGDEMVILGLASEEYFSLKEVGARIWGMIEAPKTVMEIREAIQKEYDVDPEQCERDLLRVLKEMADEGLVEIKNAETG